MDKNINYLTRQVYLSKIIRYVNVNDTDKIDNLINISGDFKENIEYHNEIFWTNYMKESNKWYYMSKYMVEKNDAMCDVWEKGFKYFTENCLHRLLLLAIENNMKGTVLTICNSTKNPILSFFQFVLESANPDNFDWLIRAFDHYNIPIKLQVVMLLRNSNYEETYKYIMNKELRNKDNEILSYIDFFTKPLNVIFSKKEIDEIAILFKINNNGDMFDEILNLNRVCVESYHGVKLDRINKITSESTMNFFIYKSYPFRKIMLMGNIIEKYGFDSSEIFSPNKNIYISFFKRFTNNQIFTLFIYLGFFPLDKQVINDKKLFFLAIFSENYYTLIQLFRPKLALDPSEYEYNFNDRVLYGDFFKHKNKKQFSLYNDTNLKKIKYIINYFLNYKKRKIFESASIPLHLLKYFRYIRLSRFYNQEFFKQIKKYMDEEIKKLDSKDKKQIRNIIDKGIFKLNIYDDNELIILNEIVFE